MLAWKDSSLFPERWQHGNGNCTRLLLRPCLTVCLFGFVCISFSRFFPLILPILGSRLTSTIQKYITTEIVKEVEAKNGRQWRACIWVPKLPACSLAANILQCNTNTTNESKMAATFSFYPCGWFFSSILSSRYFYSIQPKRSFE